MLRVQQVVMNFIHDGGHVAGDEFMKSTRVSSFLGRGQSQAPFNFTQLSFED